MRPSLVIQITSLTVASASMADCHRPAVQTAATPRASLEELHCWWAKFRTTVPPDSVAARYARAYATLGLSQTGWSHQADTAWAEGGPTVLTRPAGAGTYTAHVVAYRRGDTTFFRPFAGVRPAGTENAGGLLIPFCGDVARAAQTGGAAPRDEERDDSLPVWRRRPTR